MLFYFLGFFLIKSIISINHDIQIAQDEVQTYECTENLLIKLYDQYATVFCNEIFISSTYEDFSKYQFVNKKCSAYIVLDRKLHYTFDQMKNVLQSLKLTERRDIHFSYYERLDLLEPLIRIIPYENVDFWMYVEESTDTLCKWENYLHLINGTSWKVVCFDYHYMLHLNDNDQTVIPIKLSGNIGTILFLVFLILFIMTFVINFFIAKCQHEKISNDY